VTSDRGYADPARKYAARETWKGAAVERVSATGFGRASTLGRALDYSTFLFNAGIRLLSGPRPDVVVGLSTPPILGALAVLVARIRGARSAYWTMDVHPDVAFALGVVRPRSLAGRALSLVSGWAIRHADVVVALGETMSGVLHERGARRVAIVHNWTDDEEIRPMRPDESVYRAERGWGDRLVVGYSGNMGLAHEFDTLLDAAARLASAPVTFAFIGQGPRRAEVERKALDRRLENVEFHPSVPRAALGDALAAADLHVVSLRPGAEGLLVPSKIYGILAAGRPAVYVGPPRGEVFEIVTKGACGVVVTNGDGAALAAAVSAYRFDTGRRAREGAAARAVLEAGFRKETQTTALLAELAKLVALDRRED
jgi:colanic acid biosynthesis glycosyl transferase WcaI